MGAPSGQGRPKVSEGRLGRVSQRRVVHKLSFGKEQAGHFLMAAKGGKENKGIRAKGGKAAVWSVPLCRVLWFHFSINYFRQKFSHFWQKITWCVRATER